MKPRVAPGTVIKGSPLIGARGKYSAANKTQGQRKDPPFWTDDEKPPDGDEWVWLKSVPDVMRALDVLGVSPDADPVQARIALELRGTYANRPLIIEAMNERLKASA